MNGLFSPLSKADPFRTALSYMERKEPFLLSGVCDAAQPHMAAAFSHASSRPLVVIAPNDLRAKEIYDALGLYFPEGLFWLPLKESAFYQMDSRSLTVERERLFVLRALLEGKARALVLSAESLFDRMMPRQAFEDSALRVRLGEEIALETLLRRLVMLGYERTEQVEAQGQFSVRGGIVDFYPLSDPAGEAHACRLEFWGDEIDSIRALDIETQRSLERMENVTICPVTEVMVEEAALSMGLEKIHHETAEEAGRLKAQGLLEEAERLEGLEKRLLDRIAAGRRRDLEIYLPYFYSEAESILDYLPEDSFLAVLEPMRIRERLSALEKEWLHAAEMRLKGGYLLPLQKEGFSGFDALDMRLEPFARGFLCALLGSSQEAFTVRTLLKMTSRPNPSFSSMDQLSENLRMNLSLGYRTLLFASGKLRVDELMRELTEGGIPAYYYDHKDEVIREDAVGIARGILPKGFTYPDEKLSLFSVSELSSRAPSARRRRKRRFQGGTRLGSLSDLSVGDYVVHESHGVGIYQGITQIESGDTKKDYFKILYKDGDQLFIPSTSLDFLQKYVAGEEGRPRLNSLRGTDWQRTKSKVKEGVKELAENLMRLYAKREQTAGYAFGKDTVWQKEFEDAFPFEETEDQLTAIEETKADMESSKIMDRLICGDVGYGKTEIAIRAAFKAVQEDKQVALLAPTTILAQQHFRTFTERMADYPVRIRLLSRFRTQKEIKETVTGLRSGTVDIVIGTHKLLSREITFKDLGLLIIDEEQRFGVAHKEKIKSLRENVDVLTLSATPIPRTLHMSLSGMRDMSLLREAPEDRRPVQTYVLEEDDQVVREAIYRELARGGQVFYLYNRVESIERAAAHLKETMPEARVEIAHGQMEERQLEQVMLRFVEGEIDVLVCTTIIETGLDIPNANTLIVRDADAMGLAQLYQLRGRVGRSTRLAYAYFLYRPGKVLQEASLKRLEAISEFTDFGSGFRIAMRDLEIRGAGNVLGPEQHGHMGAVGYELYCKMLREAMEELQDSKALPSFDTQVRIEVDAFIPSDYISHEGQKLDAYQKIAAIRNREDYEDILDELIDRYGDLPLSVSNLISIALIKALSNRLGAEEIVYKEGELMLDLRPDAPLNVEELQSRIRSSKGTLRLASGGGRTRLICRVEDSAKDEKKLGEITRKLEEMQSLIQREMGAGSDAGEEK